MQHILEKIDALAAELKKLQPLSSENRQRLDKKFRLEFNYNSNHLEGNTLTYGETELLLIFDDTKGNHTMREYEEMKAHDVAYHLVEEWAKDTERPLTEQNIKNLNEVILVRPFWKDAITPDGQPTKRQIQVGNYKQYPNSVRLTNGEIFHYASPAETPVQMQELIEWFRTEERTLHPVTLAAMLHYKFVRIHPFDDGNGRVSRLLVNYVLLKNDLPPIIIKSSDKSNYLNALHLADTGDYAPFIEYVAEQLLWSLEISIRAAKGESIEEVGDLQKEISLLSKRLGSEDKQSKHPAIVYETFTSFSKNVWSAIRQSLAQFDSLFSESKEFHYVNHFPESFEKKNIFESPIFRSTEPKKIKIFGRDIYEDDIEQIEWKQVLYGLKGTKAKPDMEITAKLEFRIDKYYFTAKLGYNSVSENQYQYGDFMLKSDIEKLQSSLTKQVLEEIKQRTQTGE